MTGFFHRNRNLNRNLVSALLMLALGACVIWILIPAGVTEPKKIKYAALSPSYYPRLVAVALMMLGAGVLLRTLTESKHNVQATEDRHPQATQRIFGFFLILLFFALSLKWLGFIVAATIAMFLALLLGGERRLWLTLPLAVLIPLLLYFFFLKVARIPIPLGILEPWLAGV